MEKKSKSKQKTKLPKKEIGEVSNQDLEKYLDEGGHLVENLPKEIQKELIAVVQAKYKSYSGPIPDAKSLKKYENVLKGSANRILRMAEERQVHLKELDNKTSSYNYKTNRLGQFFGFGTVLSFSGVAVYMVHQGHPGIAGGVLGAVLLGLVGVFVKGKNEISDEDNNKTLPRK